MNVITRKEAKSLNLLKYFTGKECVNGHLVERYTQSGSCCQCVNPMSKSPRRKDSKTLTAMADNLELTALSDYNANLQRITAIYNNVLQKAAEYRKEAEENAVLEHQAPTVTPISDNVKSELSKLVTVWVPYAQETRERDEAYHLSLLQKGCAEFTLKELRYRNRSKGGKFFEIRCYPEDLNLITSQYMVKPQS